MAGDLTIGSHTPAIDIPAGTSPAPASPHSTPGSRPSSPRPSSISHSSASFGKLGALKELGSPRTHGAKPSARVEQASATSGAAHPPSAVKPQSARPSAAPRDARFDYGKPDVPPFTRSNFFGFPRPLRTRFPAAWPQGGGDGHQANFNRGFHWGSGGGIGRFAMPALGMFLGADLGMMAGAALMPGCFMPGLGGDMALDMGLGMMGGAALGALGWEAGRMFNRYPSGPSGNAYQAHYMQPPMQPYGGGVEPPAGANAAPYGPPPPAPYHTGVPAQGYGYAPQYAPSYPAYAPYPAYGGYNSGPGWGSMVAGAALGGLGFGIGEAIGADLMFDAMF